MFFELTDKQLDWVEFAWKKDRKVTIDGKFVGLCTDGQKVVKIHTWKA